MANLNFCAQVSGPSFFFSFFSLGKKSNAASGLWWSVMMLIATLAPISLVLKYDLPPSHVME